MKESKKLVAKESSLTSNLGRFFKESSMWGQQIFAPSSSSASLSSSSMASPAHPLAPSSSRSRRASSSSHKKGVVNDVFRQQLQRFYAEYNPDRLASLDQILTEYAGKEKEELLRRRLRDKYGAAPGDDEQGTARSTLVGDAESIETVAAFFATFLRRWPSVSGNARTLQLLNALTFSSDLVPRLWSYLGKQVDLERLASTGYPREGARDAAARSQVASFTVLGVFCACYEHLLVILDEAEMYESQTPLPQPHLERLVNCLKLVLFKYYWSDPGPDGAPTASETKSLKGYVMRVCARLMRALYGRASRRPFCPAATWLVSDFSGASSRVMQELVASESPRSKALLEIMPFTVPFSVRAAIFEKRVAARRAMPTPTTRARV